MKDFKAVRKTISIVRVTLLLDQNLSRLFVVGYIATFSTIRVPAKHNRTCLANHREPRMLN
jgi:hypothetical protein